MLKYIENVVLLPILFCIICIVLLAYKDWLCINKNNKLCEVLLVNYTVDKFVGEMNSGDFNLLVFGDNGWYWSNFTGGTKNIFCRY